VTAPWLVLLGGYRDDTSARATREQHLGTAFRLLTPAWEEAVASEAMFSLERAAAGVTKALDEAGLESAAVCGIGVGAMVALQLAAEQPGRVTRLALVTRQVAVSPVLMSLPAVVLRLVPAAAVARLGAGQPQILALLDQVRPVDASPLAARVTAESVVLCGARDRLNRRASARIADALPRGQLQLVSGAGPGWLTSSPELLAEALRSFVAG
jgi:3-oxoadipate enol-lactonase